METTEMFHDIAEVTTRTKYSKNTIDRYVKQGKFPRPIKIGRVRRWSSIALEEWFAKQRNNFNANNNAAQWK